MPQLQSTVTTISYAGRILVEPGDFFAADDNAFSLERSYTAQAVQVIDLDHPVLDEFGNASGSHSLSFVRDFSTPEAAMADMYEMQDFFDANQRGAYSHVFAGAERSYQACCNHFSARLGCPNEGVEVTYDLTFTLSGPCQA